MLSGGSGDNLRLALVGAGTALTALIAYRWLPNLPDGAAIVLTSCVMLLLIWTLTRVPVVLSLFLMFSVLYLGGVRDVPLLLSGFVSTTPWLLLALTILARGITALGIDVALMRRLFPDRPLRPVDVFRRFTLSTVALTPLMPSGAGKTLILLPTATQLGRQVGGRAFERAILLLMVYVNGVAAKLFIMSAGALLVATIIANATGHPISWLGWMQLAVVPVTGMLLLLYGLLRWLNFGPDGQPKDARDQSAMLNVKEMLDQVTEAAVPTTRLQWGRGVACFGLFLVAWMFDTVHGINPLFLSFMAVVGLYTPSSGAIALPDLRRDIPWDVIFSVGATLSLSQLFTQSGVADYLAVPLVNAVTGLPALLKAGLFMVGAAVIRLFFVSNFAFLGVIVPLALKFAEATGLNPITFGLMAGLVGSAALLFPTQSIPGMLVTGTGRLSRSELFRFGLLYSSGTIAWLLVMAATYWPLVGYPLHRAG